MTAGTPPDRDRAHGGDIEIAHDDQAQRVARCLADTAVITCWQGLPCARRGENLHITSVDIDPGSFPLLNSVFSRLFAHPWPSTL